MRGFGRREGTDRHSDAPTHALIVWGVGSGGEEGGGGGLFGGFGRQEGEGGKTIESVAYELHPSRYENLYFSVSIKTTHAVRWAPSFRPSVASPINAILLLPRRKLRSPQSVPPRYQRRHQRNRPLTRDVLRHQEEHRRTSLLRPFSTLFHLFSKNFTISPRFVSFVNSR